MIQVYHLSHISPEDWRYDAIHFPRIAEAPPEFGDVKDVPALAVNLLIAEGYYEHAADVDSDDPEEAFYLTNSIEVSWFDVKHPRLKAMMTSKRSTSVGDIMVTAEGVFIVASMGFKPVNGPL